MANAANLVFYFLIFILEKYKPAEKKKKPRKTDKILSP